MRSAESPFSLWCNLQELHHTSGNLIEGIRRIDGALVVAIIQEELPPLVGVRDLAYVYAEPDGGHTYERGGRPEPSIDVRHQMFVVTTSHGAQKTLRGHQLLQTASL